jgi:internalin A
MRRHSPVAWPVLLGCVVWLGAAAFAAEVKRAPDTQWIADVGGTVIEAPAGRITGVNLRASWVTDTDLRGLARLPYLTTLDLSLTRITDQGMQELKSLPGIVDLNLRYAEYVTDEGLSAIKGWRKLKRLNAHGAKISDTTLDHISGIATLESLDIGSAMVTDIGLERLTSLPNLKELTIGGNKLTDAGLQALRQMPGLNYLDLAGRQGTDANIWAIRMSDVGLDAILALKALRELRFSCTSIGVGLEGTKFADVSYVSVTTGWLERMKALPNLEKLTLQGCDRLNDDSVRVLAAMPRLTQVDLKGSTVTEKGIATLKAAKPGIQVYSGPWVAQAANFRNN